MVWLNFTCRQVGGKGGRKISSTYLVLTTERTGWSTSLRILCPLPPPNPLPPTPNVKSWHLVEKELKKSLSFLLTKATNKIFVGGNLTPFPRKTWQSRIRNVFNYFFTVVNYLILQKPKPQKIIASQITSFYVIVLLCQCCIITYVYYSVNLLEIYIFRW